MVRKMPHANDTKTHGKFDKKKFQDNMPAAMDAMGGETTLSEVHIVAKNGQLRITSHRSHSHKKNDVIPPAISQDLVALLGKHVAEDTVKDVDMNESNQPGSSSDDVLTVTGSIS